MSLRPGKDLYQATISNTVVPALPQLAVKFDEIFDKGCC